ncbi:MAG TPA: ABC transporter ATP-binding protein [Dongiaceae bacterium]|jgi:simple sugar transport system ATP-binding protein|nr:ABC transporter ATP-binding protein [Dongiaceae bacterium]
MATEQVGIAGSPSAATRPAAIELRGIDKSFGAVRANRNVDLTIAKGSIHGIIGENGAGKSTLMSILYGFYTADAGEILINGKAARIHSSHDAIAAGIGMVHQHFMLVEPFTVLENVMLGAEGGVLLRSGAAKARTELQRLARDYGLNVDPDTHISELPVGEQQRVEILKALFRHCDILILDEPTGVLTPQETDQLFQILRALNARGVTIVLITHKLREILAITDTVSVMRQGEMVATLPTRQATREQLAELMVGRKVRLELDKTAAEPGEERLSVRNLSVIDGKGVPRVDNVSFDVRAGEIVGIAGVSGNGQSELLEALSGIRLMSSGEIHLCGRVISTGAPCGPASAREYGMAHVPEDRLRLGVVTAFPAWESCVLGYHEDAAYNGRVLMDHEAMADACGKLMERFDVRPRDPDLKCANLSGGNQQKLILAREIDRKPKVLLVGQPTRGVDIGAIEFIHRQLLALRDAGCAILLVSVELDEVMSLSDRILVMFQGRIVGEVNGAEAEERTLGLMMANAHTQTDEAA